MEARQSYAEARETKLIQLVAARTSAIIADIKIGRRCTLRAIEDILSNDTEYQSKLVRVGVLAGRSVGYMVVQHVNKAIEQYAEHLASLDLAEMDRQGAPLLPARADQLLQAA